MTMSEPSKSDLNVDLSGQTAIVTGASQGLGKAMAFRLAGAGAKVACVARNAEKLADAVAAITDAGGIAEAISCSVTDEESVQKVVDDVIEKWGQLDILVNNAGIIHRAPLSEMSDEDWCRVLDVNINGAFRLAKLCLPAMTDNGWGRIINIGSVAGQVGNAGQANYAAAKAGIVGLTKSMAKEMAGKNITANVVAPGFIETDMTDGLPDQVKEFALAATPAKRFGQSDEVAATVAYLAGEESGFTTGQVICVDGGLTMC